MVPAFKVSQLNFTTPAPSPEWGDVIYAESIGVWLALRADDDKVARSLDGITWTYETLPDNGNWLALVWAEDLGLFAAFCTNNSGISVATSPDGITWSNAHAQRANIKSCAYGQGQFIGVGGQKQVIVPSAFALQNFSSGGIGAFAKTLSFNAGNASIILVGVVGNVTDTLTTVTFNGNACTLVQKVKVTGDRWIYLYKLLNPTLGGSFNLTVNFNAAAPPATQGAAIYVGAYEAVEDVVQSSTLTGSSASIATALTTTFDESWMVQFSCNAADSAGSDGGSTFVRFTSDGEGGTFADSQPNPFFGGALTPPGSHTLTVSVTNSQWAAIAVEIRPSVNTGLITSGDGATWVQSEINNLTLQAVAYSPDLDLFAALGADGNGGGLGTNYNIITSTDGATWTWRELPVSGSADLSQTGNCSIVWADDLGIFVAVLSSGDVVKSADGITWDTLTPSADPDAALIIAVTWAKRLQALIFIGDDDGVSERPLMYSEDGDTILSVPFSGLAGSWTTMVYSPAEDHLIAFDEFNDTFAMLVEFGPTVSSVTPPSGDVVGGNSVTVAGLGFQTGAEVVFDNFFATDVVVVNDTEITCVVPAHQEQELVDVTVTNTDARFDVGEDLYDYTTDSSGDEPGGPGVPPMISLLGVGCASGSIDPASGPIVGGTPITIYGQGFRLGSTVLFGGTACTDVVVDPSGTFLTCVTPAHQSGEVDVEILEP